VTMLRDQVQPADPVICERRDDRGITVSLAGRYSLANRINERGECRQYACRAVNVSPRVITLAAPVTAKPGVPVIAKIEQLGTLKGLVIREFKLGFAMSIAASDQERETLATKIDWVEKHKGLQIADHREHARFIPRRPYAFLMLADGSIVPCFVIDISISGVAISADILPKIGTVLAVGKIVGRVVRHIAEGFAVKFAALPNRKEVEALVTRS
jgi:PilZ domain